TGAPVEGWRDLAARLGERQDLDDLRALLARAPLAPDDAESIDRRVRRRERALERRALALARETLAREPRRFARRLRRAT
ncbi:MAG: hypothetical protein KC560_15200, partial [Myxococcales bacterium]|nr:hypothetical protein [Myxococcales bacterium]